MTIVYAAWIFFRAPTLTGSVEYLWGIVSLRSGLDREALQALVLALTLTLFIDIPQEWCQDHTAILRWPWVLRGVTYAGLVMVLVVLRTSEHHPFIYFQF